jgi:excisionase family DNA binding protein
MSVASAYPETKAPVGPALYVADDLASLLQCSKRNIWRLNDSGALPGAVRVGRLVRWRVEAINDWIQNGCPRGK